MSSPATIEKLVQRAGATRFVYDWTPKQAVIGFELRKRAIRIPVDLPDPNDHSFTRTPARGEQRSPVKARQLYEEAAGRVWAELADAIAAKLRLVSAGRSTVDQEFLAFIVLPDGASVGEWLGPQIEQSYADGALIPLLSAPRTAVGRE